MEARENILKIDLCHGASEVSFLIFAYTKINGEMMPEQTNKILLRDAVSFQEGSIVSRQILKKPNGNITLFAFDKEQSLTEHTSPFEAVVNIIAGEMEIKIGGVPHKVMEGEIIILPPNIPHGLVAKQKSKMLLTMIK